MTSHSYDEYKELIVNAFDSKDFSSDHLKNAIQDVINGLDKGKLRIASKDSTGKWHTHGWLQKAILLYFATQEQMQYTLPPFEFTDKVPLKTGLHDHGVRVVPPATARYGSYIANGVVLMPSYINIGAYVDSGTMVDTWATVGSGAQIGKNVHLAGGVGIGGVLEPAGATPVIVEDNCFIGSRCIVVEGVHIKSGAVLAANVSITASTKIIDVTGTSSKEYTGVVPENSVVVPGSVQKNFPAGNYNVNCALIIGKRKESTNAKTALNDFLR